MLPFDRRMELIDEITAHIAEARTADTADPGATRSVRDILERLGDPADIVRAAAEAGADRAADNDPAGQFGYQAGGIQRSGMGMPLAAGQARGAGRGRIGALEICAVILLLIGGIILPFIGWAIGVILLWISPRWGRADKWLGTLVWPGGLLAPLVLAGFGGLAAVTVNQEQVCTPQPHVVVSHVAAQGAGGASPLLSHMSQTAIQPYAPCQAGSGTPNWLAISAAIVVLAIAIAGPIYTASRLLRRARQASATAADEPRALIPA